MFFIYNIFVMIILLTLCFQTYCGEEGTSPTLAPHLEMYVRANFLHSPVMGEAEWCYNTPPIAYSHVQDKYWEVGISCFTPLRNNLLKNYILHI